MGCVQSKQITCPSCNGNKKNNTNEDIISSQQREITGINSLQNLYESRHSSYIGAVDTNNVGDGNNRIIACLVKNDDDWGKTADSNVEPTQQNPSVHSIRDAKGVITKDCKTEDRHDDSVQNNEMILESDVCLSCESDWGLDTECGTIAHANSCGDPSITTTSNVPVNGVEPVGDCCSTNTSNCRDVVIDMLLEHLLYQVVNVVHASPLNGSNSTQHNDEQHKHLMTNPVHRVSVDDDDSRQMISFLSNNELQTVGIDEDLASVASIVQEHKEDLLFTVTQQTAVADSEATCALKYKDCNKALSTDFQQTMIANNEATSTLKGKESQPNASRKGLTFINVAETRKDVQSNNKLGYGDDPGFDGVSKEANIVNQLDKQHFPILKEDDDLYLKQQGMILANDASTVENATEPLSDDKSTPCEERLRQHQSLSLMNLQKQQKLCIDYKQEPCQDETLLSINLIQKQHELSEGYKQESCQDLTDTTILQQISIERKKQKNDEIVTVLEEEQACIDELQKSKNSEIKLERNVDQALDKMLPPVVKEECRYGMLETDDTKKDNTAQQGSGGILNEGKRCSPDIIPTTASLDDNDKFTDITVYLESSEDERYLPSPPSLPSSTTTDSDDSICMWPSNSVKLAAALTKDISDVENERIKPISSLETIKSNYHGPPTITVSSGCAVNEQEFDDEQVEAIAVLLYDINLVREEHGLGPVSTSFVIKFLMAREFIAELSFTLYMNYQTQINIYRMTSPYKDPLRKELVSGHFTVMKPRDEVESATAILYAQRCTQKSHSIVMQSIRFQLDEALQNIKVRTNGMVLLYDFKNITFKKCDLKLCTKILDLFMNAYPVKVHSVYVISPPLWFNPVMNGLSTILREHDNIQTINKLTQCMPGSYISDDGSLRHDHMTWINHCFFSFSSRRETGN